MSGFSNDGTSLANGIPARQISPETGSFGDATMTNKGGTSEGTNEAADSRPSPEAGLDADKVTTDDLGEHRSFARKAAGSGITPDADLESPAQQIADGGDHFKHGKRFSDEKHDHKPDHK
jgi:hypothetical protein